MTKQKMGILVIRFIDGTEERLEYARLPQEETNLAARIEEALNANHLVVEVEGKMVVYPFQSIKAIEVFPAPEKVPRAVIRKARFSDRNL
jgi:hypothetical protein